MGGTGLEAPCKSQVLAEPVRHRSGTVSQMSDCYIGPRANVGRVSGDGCARAFRRDDGAEAVPAPWGARRSLRLRSDAVDRHDRVIALVLCEVEDSGMRSRLLREKLTFRWRQKLPFVSTRGVRLVVATLLTAVAASLAVGDAQAHVLPASVARAYIQQRGLDLADAYAWNQPGSHPRFHIDGCRRFSAHVYFCVTTLYHNDPAGLYDNCWYTISASIGATSSRVRTSVHKESCG
jgi:hypothetical protein